jgi:hypothetical protein
LVFGGLERGAKVPKRNQLQKEMRTKIKPHLTGLYLYSVEEIIVQNSS